MDPDLCDYTKQPGCPVVLHQPQVSILASVNGPRSQWLHQTARLSRSITSAPRSLSQRLYMDPDLCDYTKQPGCPVVLHQPQVSITASLHGPRSLWLHQTARLSCSITSAPGLYPFVSLHGPRSLWLHQTARLSCSITSAPGLYPSLYMDPDLCDYTKQQSQGTTRN